MSELNLKDYMENADGALIPLTKVSAVDVLRDELVKKLISDGKLAQKIMMKYKAEAMGGIEDLITLSATEYGASMGGKKGNVTLMSYDGKYKIQRAITENIVFDERLQVAKSLIDECLDEWTKGSSDEIKAIITLAFKTNNEGQVSTARIIALQKLDIIHEKWQQAMQAITDARQIAGSKSYVRLYERDEQGQYQAIPLDLAAL